MKFICSLLFLISFSSFAQPDTVSIYFNIGSFEASEDELDKLQPESDWVNVDIISYTDYLGTEEFNQKLSTNRSREIRSRLVEKGLSTEILGLVEGRGITGITLDTKDGIQENRRTDVIFHKDTAANFQLDEMEVVEKNPIDETSDEQSLSEEIEGLEVGANLVLKKLSFIPGEHFLIKESMPSLDTLIQVMKSHPSLKIAIEGHICCKPVSPDGTILPDGYDQTTLTQNLSVERAKYIYEQLIENDIDEDRLSYEGFGRKKPIYPRELNTMEQQANRRVEIKIIEK